MFAARTAPETRKLTLPLSGVAYMLTIVRDRPKKDKYPFGYPGDEFGPKSVPHYECLNCKTVYPTGVEDGTECRKCKFPKSHASPRARPRKVEPIPDPEVIRRLQAKLDDLNLT